MTYTVVMDEGVVVRDLDQVVVAPSSRLDDPAYVEWLSWCEAGGVPAEVETRGRVLPPTPDKVTRRQMLTALHRLGWLEAIKAAVESSGDVELQIFFNEAQEFERSHPAIAAMAASFGNTQEQVDQLFILADSI